MIEDRFGVTISRDPSLQKALFFLFFSIATDGLYNITVFTADESLAGTDARVYITLYGFIFGMEQSTGKLRLDNGRKDQFLRGGCVLT